MDAIIDGVSGVNFVCTGCDVTAQGSPDMTCAVSAGVACSNDTYFSVTAGNVTITTAHATLPRIDLVVVDSAGAKAVRAGTAATNPKPPARTANDVLLAAIYIPAADTTIATNQITGLRITRPERARSRTLASNATANSTTTGVEITGLSLFLEPGTYRFKYHIIYQAGAITTGVQFAVNYTGTVTKLVANFYAAESTTAASTGAATQAGYLVTTMRLLGVSSARAKATTVPNLGATTAVDAANSDMLAVIEGTMVVTTTGEIELWHASEVAASSQVMSGSNLVVERVA
jgi:hypothetical protein